MRILSLFDYSGVMVQPWRDAGFDCTTVDIKHGVDIKDFVPAGDYYAIFAFPPCTDLASSGARWFASKGEQRLLDALELVWLARLICLRHTDRWMIENPVGRLSTHWRKPDYSFDPCDYGDPYTKKTCLWTSDFFVMPPKNRVEPTEGSKMHRLPPSPLRQELRSVTPQGFAQAVFEVNKPT